MLKTIHPLLNADVLFALRQMGHGDDLVLTDTNFPAEALARKSSFGRLLRMDADIITAIRVLLTQYPLDTFVDDPVRGMQVVGKPNEILPVHKEIQAEIDRAEGAGKFNLQLLERYAFYDATQKTFAVIQTQERRFYANALLRMGVIPPDVKF
jgi:L-fucose mutarotase